MRKHTRHTQFGDARRSGLWRMAILAIAGALVLAGCGSGSSGSSSSAKTMTFWLSASDAQAAGYYDLAKAFKAKTGISVKIVNVPYDAYQTKLRQAAQANSLPDSASVPSLDPIWTNKLQDLSSIAKSAQVNDAFIVKGDDGKLLTIPSDVTAAGLFINKSLFDKAKVTYPTDPAQTWTWDDFLAAIDKVRKAAGAKYDMVYDASPARLKAYIYEHGGKGFQLGSDGKFEATPGTTELLDSFAKLNNDVIMPKSVWGSGGDPNALFKSGQVVAYFSGVWQVADFAESITKFEWAAVPTPAQPTQATDLNTGGHVVAYDNGGGKAAAALKWVQFMFDRTNYTKLAETNGYLPILNGLDLKYPFTNKTALDAFALYNKEISLADPISASGHNSQMKMSLEGKSVADDPTVPEMAKLINGQQDAQKTADNIVAGLNQQIG
jgi:alpha-1,4-digalacturonate transport system substrate-binding protein